MKKTLLLVLAAAVLLGTAACSPSEEGPSNLYERAVGAIFVNSGQELEGRIYGDFTDKGYTYDLDAALVYFFSPDEESAYAGNPNFAHMRFDANIDTDIVGAVGTIAYRLEEDSENTVSAYYLYWDEGGLFFDAASPFAAVEVKDGCSLEGEAYPCTVTFEVTEPVSRFTLICYDGGHSAVSERDYSPAELTDYQRFDMAGGIHSAEIIQYGPDGAEQGRYSLTPEDSSAVICYDNGRQILASKSLRFIWE